MESLERERMIDMENNQTDFMKNHPGSQTANQFKDVYGSQKRSTFVTVTAVLAVIDLIIFVIGLITSNNFIIIVFGPLLAILFLSVILGVRADRQNTPPEPTEHPDAIFQDHDV